MHRGRGSRRSLQSYRQPGTRMHELVQGLSGRRTELQTNQNYCYSDIRLLSSRRSLRADDSSGGLGSTQALQE